MGIDGQDDNLADKHGWRVHRATDLGAVESVGDGEHRFGGYALTNEQDSTLYLQVFDQKTAPTLGSDTPKMTFPIPAGVPANVEWSRGVDIDHALHVAVTSDLAGTTAATSNNGLVANILYR